MPNKAILMKLKKKTIFKLVGWDVECVLQDMGREDILEDADKFSELIYNLINSSMNIPWSEYLEESINLHLNETKESKI